jgi:EAL domain-containing protein (putative c-di-GMP-specific phosphodiesterase class I)
VLDSCDPEQTSQAAARFLTEISRPAIETSAGPLPVALRLGSVVAPKQGRTAQRIFQHAEEALQTARSSGTTRHVAYEASLQVDMSRRLAQSVAEQVVTALNDRRIEIYLEPVVAAETETAVFHEALIRLRLEDGTVLRPASFLGTAESVGLITLLDQRVFELAIERLVEDPSLQLSVNVSGMTLHEIDWPARTRAALSLHPGVAERLIVEITETVAIADPDATRAIIKSLNGMGVRVAMDDFGAGHTSFRNLRSLGFDIIKIDGAFIQNLSQSSDDRFFVRTLVELAKHIGVATVAEWVEDGETARILKEWGVTYFQGTFYRHYEVDAAPVASLSCNAA